MATKRKPTPAQIAARERFAEMARSGAFKRKAKRNPAKKTVSQKISQLTREGYPQKQAVAIALSEERAGKVKRNPAKKRSKPDPFVLAEIERANAHWAKTFGFSPDLIEMIGARTKFLEGQGLSYKDAFQQAVAEARTKTGPFAILKNNPVKTKRNPRASNPIILVSDKPITSKRKANPVKPKDMTVYQVQYRKPGMKLFEPWMTVMYPKMAEDIARRLADEPMAQTWTIKVESIKVKG